MDPVRRQPKPNRSKSIVKAVGLIVFMVAAILLVRFTPIKDYLTADALGRFLDRAGLWAPLIFMLVYAVGVYLFVPETLLTGMGAAICPYWGFVYVWTSGDWGRLVSFKVFFSIALFIFSFFIPKIIKNIKGER